MNVTHLEGVKHLKVAKRLGIKEEISELYPEASDRRVHETLEALLGAYWLGKSEIPVELVKRMLSTLNEEERLPIRTEDDLLELKYPGSHLVSSKDEKGAWTVSLIGPDGKVIRSVGRGKQGSALKTLRREELGQSETD